MTGAKEGFSNPVVNAAGTLIRAVMKSVNYVAGLAGWQVTRDGDAEFNSVVVRGDVEIGPASPGPRLALTSNIPATLVAASADFDWDAGTFFWFNGTDYEFEVIGTYIPGPNTPIWAKGTYDTLNGVIYQWLIINAGGTPIVYYGSNVYNSVAMIWRIRNGAWNFEDTSSVEISGNFTQGNFPDGYACMGNVLAGTAATSVAAAEAAIPAATWALEPHMTFVNGFMYRVDVLFGVQMTAFPQVFTVRLRKGSATVAGQQLCRWSDTSRQATFAEGYTKTGWIYNASGADITTDLSLTIARISAAGNASLFGDAGQKLEVVIQRVGYVDTVGAGLEHVCKPIAVGIV